MPTADEFLFGGTPPPPADAPPPTPPPKPQTADDFLFGATPTPEATPEAPAMSKLEQAAWTVGGVAVPMIAGVAGSAMGTPIVGAGAAGAGSAAVEAARQAREKSLGIRKDYSVGAMGWEGVMGTIPGAPLEKLGIKSLGPKIAARVVEGTGMGGLGVTGRTAIEEGRLPTADEFLFGAGLGALGGGVVGGGTEAYFHGRAPHGEPTVEVPPVEGAPAEPPPPRNMREAIQRAEERRAAEDAAEAAWQPHPVGSEVRFRDIGEEGRNSQGRIVDHAVDSDGRPSVVVETPQGDRWERRMRDVELAPGADFVGPPEPPPVPWQLPDTKIVDPETGGPRRMFHGTPNAFTEFRSEGLNERSLYGPGYYFTDHPDVATGYSESTRLGIRDVPVTDLDALEQHFQPGKELPSKYRGENPDEVVAFHRGPEPWQWSVDVREKFPDGSYGWTRNHRTAPTFEDVYGPVEHAPQIHPAYVDIRNPFDVRATYDTQPILETLQRVGHEGEADLFAAAVAGHPQLEGNTLYKLLTNLYEGSKADVNNLLQQAGYDGITHTGGLRQGKGVDRLHEVAIAFSPDQIHSRMALDAQARTGSHEYGPPPPPPEPPGGRGPQGPPPEGAATAAGPPEDGGAQSTSSPFEEPSFRRVHGMHEAAFGEPPSAARARDQERLAGEVVAVDRNFAHLPENQRNLLKQVILTEEGDIAKRARQTQPVQRTKDLADELQFDPETAVKKSRGETWKAEELHAAGSHIGGLLDDIQDLATRHLADPENEALLVRLQKKQNELVASVRAYEGAKAETGRSLNILRYQQAALYKGDPAFIKRALKLGADPGAILQIIQSGKSDAEKMRALIGLRRVTKLEYAKTFWMSNVLSGPKTHLRNLVANTAALVQAPFTAPLAAGVERVRLATGLQKGPRTVYAREGWQQARGAYFGMKEAWRQAREAFMHGYDFNNPQGIDFELPPIEMFPNAPDSVRRAVNWVPRALGAADRFSRTLAYHMDLYGAANTHARNELLPLLHAGKIPKAQFEEQVQRRMTDLIARPPEEMTKNAEQYAQRRVFQEHGKLDEGLLHLRESFSPLGFVIPFIRTPVAIARQGLQAAGLGYHSRFHGKAPSTRLSAQIRGEAAAGSILLGGLAAAVAEGTMKVHGTGPTDPVDRDAFFREGHRPNSVEIGPYTIGFGALGPLAIPISMVGNGFDAYAAALKNKDLEGADMIAQRTLTDTMARSVKSFTDQSFVKGLSDFVDMLSDPDQKASKYFGSLASGFIPYSGLARGVNQAIDPTLRQPETVTEYMQAGVPGLGQNVPPRIRATGQPIEIEQAGGALGRMLLPTDITTRHPDPIQTELDRIGVRLTFPRGDEVRKQKLPREQEVILQEAKGQAAMAALEKLFAQPSYQKAKPEIQARQAQRAIDAHRAVIGRRAVPALAGKRPFTVESLLSGR